MSLARSAVRPLRAAPTPSSSRAASSRAAKPTVPWKSKTHTRKAPGLPLPLPAIFPQRVVLSDGSTFTSYTTAPSPSIVRLARDVTNNPMWAPGTEKAGAQEDDEGAVGRFRRRFAGADAAAAATAGADAAPPAQSFKADDLSWMSEGAKEEILSDKERAGRAKPKGKKK
ncbi:uncharacterized protein LOC62_04G005710 [Vanrija pseudolonga]|uniref:Uncharacterized protein n=1 Tax=Vanrija pseudolonga TaxID=143232 RepID=A0AAF1BRH8_9TREE|nr:hypothetical protein LOC62_04G005710 [Vanrija pseudolonga]